MGNGVLTKTWEVHCIECERPALGIGFGGSSDEAAAELRADGWRIRGGWWACRVCAPILTARRLAKSREPRP